MYIAIQPTLNESGVLLSAAAPVMAPVMEEALEP